MSFISCSHWGQFFKQWKAPKMEVYTQSAFVIAGQSVSGTVVVQPVDSLVYHLSLTLIGREIHKGVKHVFLKEPVLSLNLADASTIPFQHDLALSLNGSLDHSQGSIEYYLHSELWYMRLNRIKHCQYQKKIQLYSNPSRWSEPDLPIRFQAQDRHVSLDLHLPHTLYHQELCLHLALENRSTQPVSRIELRLLRHIGAHVEILKTRSTLGWWQPLAPGCRDDLDMTLPLPANSFSTDGQKELNVSFFLQVFLQKDRLVATLPILLVHPSSLPATTVPDREPGVLSRMHGWILDRSPSLSSFASQSSTVENVESYASEKVEIGLL